MPAPTLTWVTLALMTTSSAASLRAAPTMAVYGLACVFLYLVPALASNGLYTAIVIMVLYWTGVWVSSRGTKALAGLSSWGLIILPALAISWVVPSDQTSLTAGVMQASNAFFSCFHIGWMTPIAAVMLVSASLSGMLTWLAGPSKGLLEISRSEGYLPPFLQKLNRFGVRQNILVTQGVVTTVIALGYALLPFVPPSQFGGGSVWSYVGIIGGGLIILSLLTPWAFLKFRKPGWRTTAQAADGTTAGGVA
ncbi:amino acid permease [Streptomyces prunicolor]|uniref:amino acid permease n=1 Tax=Streptomyces prunicolor TaxID=67348 RepID=UPI00371C3952